MATRAAAGPTRTPRWPTVLAWAVAGLTMLSGAPALWLLSRTWLAGVDEASPTVGTVAPVVLVVVSAMTVGALVASHRPRHPVGWLLLGVGLGVASNVLVEPYVTYGLLVRPGSLPGAGHLVGFVYSSFFVALSCAGFVLLLTPTGRLPSPRWRWWARVAAAAPVVTMVGLAVQPDPLAPEYYGNPLAVPALAPVLLPAALAGIAVVALSLLVAAGSLVVRFRRARGVERLQLRWLALAAAVASVLLLVALVAGGLGRDPGGAVVPGPLPGPGAAGHGGVDPALPALRPGPDHQPHPGLDAPHRPARAGVRRGGARARAAAARQLQPGRGRRHPGRGAAFQPARRRIQAVVDRRFNRRRFDAARTVDGFAARLRDQVDLDALAGELLAVVDRTMQPATASLWLRQRTAGEQTSS